MKSTIRSGRAQERPSRRQDLPRAGQGAGANLGRHTPLDQPGLEEGFPFRIETGIDGDRR